MLQLSDVVVITLQQRSVNLNEERVGQENQKQRNERVGQEVGHESVGQGVGHERVGQGVGHESVGLGQEVKFDSVKKSNKKQ